MGERQEQRNGLRKEQQERFLEGLAETCHVGRSALLAGKLHRSSFYRLRYNDPDFAAKWDEAIETARARIEASLMARAIASLEASEAADAAYMDAALQPLDFDKVMQLLKYYRTAPPQGARHGGVRRYASQEETDAVLIAKLDALEARVKKRRAAERAAKREAKAARAVREGQGE